MKDLHHHLISIPLPFSDHPSSLILCDQTRRIRGRERDKPNHQITIIPHVISSSFDPISSINTTLSSIPSQKRGGGVVGWR